MLRPLHAHFLSLFGAVHGDMFTLRFRTTQELTFPYQTCRLVRFLTTRISFHLVRHFIFDCHFRDHTRHRTYISAFAPCRTRPGRIVSFTIEDDIFVFHLYL